MQFAMGDAEVVELLNQNLEQEKVALDKLQTISERLAQEAAQRLPESRPAARSR